MVRIHAFLLIAIAASVLFGCVTTGGDLIERVASADSEQSDSTGANENGDDSSEESDGLSGDDSETETGVRIKSEPAGASVFINGDYAGRTPVLLDLEAGEYDIVLRKIGYYTDAIEVSYSDGEYRHIEVALKEITGYLYVATDPVDAQITIDGTPVSAGVTELRVGTYLVTVSAFGFERQSERVRIDERRTAELDVTLAEAALVLSDFKTSRSVVNPHNPGRLGEVVFSFDVTTYGLGTARIKTETGETVRRIGLERFETWNQNFAWDGKNDSGRAVEDGMYRAEIEARGENGDIDEAEPVAIRVSRKAIIAYRSGWSGVAGTLYAPAGEILPISSFQLSTLAGGTISETAGRVPIQAFFRLPVIAQLELAAQGSVIMNATGSVPVSAGLSAKYDIVGAADGTAPIGLAGYAVGTVLLRTTADTQTNFAGGRVGIVGTLRGGPFKISGAVDVAVAPFPVSYDATESPSGVSVFTYGRLGAGLDVEGFSVAVSAAARTTSFTTAFAIQLPFAVGAEIHWLIPGTYVVLSGIAFSEIENAESYYISYGGGIGIVH